MIPRRDMLVIALVAVWASLAPAPAAALDDDGGLRSVFALGAGNRALGLGGAYVAVADDASAALWNPAGLAALERRRIEATHTNLFGLGFSEQYLSLALPHWRWGTTSLTVRLFGTDGIEARDDRNVLLGEDLEDRETEILLAHARTLGRGVSAGLGVKMQQQRLAGYAGNAFGVDLGLMARPLEMAGDPDGDAWTLGICIRNLLEPKLRLDQESVPDPRAVRLGSAWRVDLAHSLDGLLSLDMEKTAGMDPRMHAGLEATYAGTASVRAGSLAGSLTAGFGLRWHDLVVDFAYEDHVLGGVKRVGVTLLQGKSVAEVKAQRLAEAEADRIRELAEAFEVSERQRRDRMIQDVRQALATEDHERALALTEMALALDPEDAQARDLKRDALWIQARSQEVAGEQDLAVLTLTRLLAQSPQDREADVALKRLRSEAALRHRRSAEIQTHYDAGLDAFAANDLDGARASFQAALDLAPEDADARAMLVRVDRASEQRLQVQADEVRSLGRAGLVDEAERAFSGLEKLGARQELLTELLGVLAEARTRRDYDRELRRRERERETEIAALSGTEPSSSATQETETVALDPARLAELSRLSKQAGDRYAAGNVDEAVRLWELVWSENPADGAVRDALRQEYLSRGMEHFSSGRLDQAVSSWEQALRVDPEDKRVRSYLDRGRRQQARILRLQNDAGR